MRFICYISSHTIEKKLSEESKRRTIKYTCLSCGNTQENGRPHNGSNVCKICGSKNLWGERITEVH